MKKNRRAAQVVFRQCTFESNKLAKDIGDLMKVAKTSWNFKEKTVLLKEESKVS
jgi:hypothetical protein